MDKTGTTSRSFGLLEEKGIIDDAWLDDLAENEPVGVAEAEMVGSALVSGKGDIGLGRQGGLVREIGKGAPLGVVYPVEDGTVVSVYFGCVMDKAPNQAAGELLMAWLFTTEAQEALAEAAYYPLVDGIAPLEPFPPVAEVKNFTTVPGKEEPRVIASMTEKMKKRFG